MHVLRRSIAVATRSLESRTAGTPFLDSQPTTRRAYSQTEAGSPTQGQAQVQKTGSNPNDEKKEPKKRKTQAELDEELKQKLAGIDSEGGAAGVEYEDGQPASMKRSVRNNMFRYI